MARDFRAEFPDIAAIVDAIRKTGGPDSVRVRCIRDTEGKILMGSDPDQRDGTFTISIKAIEHIDRFYEINKVKPVTIFERERYGKRF